MYKGLNAGKGERVMVICPACAADLDFDEDELDEGDEFTCGECATNLRVTSLDPIELELSDEEDEDDEDEDDDFDEDEDDEDDEPAEDEGEEDWR